MAHVLLKSLHEDITSTSYKYESHNRIMDDTRVPHMLLLI